jgi:outer membrane protein assembly factor BamB
MLDDLDVFSNGQMVLKRSDSQTGVYISIFDENGRWIRDLVQLFSKNGQTTKQYQRETYVRWRLDPDENIVVLKNLERKLYKYDQRGSLLWQKDVDNKVLREFSPREDSIEAGPNSISIQLYIFNLDIDEKGRIFVGHNSGGQVFSPQGQTLTIFKGYNLNVFLVQKNELCSFLPQGNAYIYKIHY